MRPTNPRLSALITLVAVLTPVFAAAPVHGQVIISEIMYNPASSEGRVGVTPNQTEWVEIYNAGDEEVSLSGWHLQDEDGKTVGLPASAKIKPGEAVVLIPGVQSVTDFRAAWGTGFQVFKLKGWAEGDDPLSGLANSPSEKNEILTLRDKAGKLVDEVNYDDQDDWPSDNPHGPSIALKPDKLDAEQNDDGKNWMRSEADKHGAKNAKKTEEYREDDIGSPGKVATE